MAGALRKTMEYLGLAEVDEYDGPGRGANDEWDEMDDDTTGHGRHADADEAERPGGSGGSVRAGYGQVTPIRSRTAVRDASDHRTAASEEEPVQELRRITTIHPRTYNEAKAIGESFRSGVPVIMNLTDMSDADAKRLVDFSAGLVFGMRGAIERVTNKVFLLSPEHVAITGETVAPRPARLFNQS